MPLFDQGGKFGVDRITSPDTIIAARPYGTYPLNGFHYSNFTRRVNLGNAPLSDPDKNHRELSAVRRSSIRAPSHHNWGSTSLHTCAFFLIP